MKPARSFCFLAILFCVQGVFLVGTYADVTVPERVVIREGTLYAASGEMLRGTTFFLDVYDVADMRKNEAEYKEYFASIFDQSGLNCVRICPWFGRWQYDIATNEHHQAEYLYVLDKVVKWCAENGAYAIVNLHIEYNTPVDVAKAKAAWNVLGPRYRDQPHVIYELVNEPEPASSLAGMSDLFRHVRRIAPETHLILFSHVAATQLTEEKLRIASEGIDYTNASVGFHCYDSVLQSTVQWDRATELREAGYPMICTEFISLTNNNDMPISYEHLMHCMMRAEERGLAWISWGPFAQYRNANKAGWTHEAIRYDETFFEQLAQFGVDFANGPTWPEDGAYRLQCASGDGYLENPSGQPWANVEVSADDDSTATVWTLQRIDGNIYRLKSKHGTSSYLHGDFTDERAWLETKTADSHADWNSQNFQLRRVEQGLYRLKCLWGDQFLTGHGRNNESEPLKGVRTGPLNLDWKSQQWRLVPVTQQ